MPGMDRRVEPARSDSFARVSSNIAKRIRGVCANWPEPEFRALVQHMAAIEVKFALRGDVLFLTFDAGSESERDSSFQDMTGSRAAEAARD